MQYRITNTWTDAYYKIYQYRTLILAAIVVAVLISTLVMVPSVEAGRATSNG